MAFLLLIVEPRGQRATRAPAEARDLYDAMVAYGESLRDAGQLLAVESLRPDDHAVRISTREGKLQVVDGPFAEAKEMVGGFFLIDVATRDEAVAIARCCPAIAWASVEVRECAPCHAS